MQVRSRMAAWMLAAALVGAVGFRPAVCLAGGPVPVKQQVKLNMRLDGTKEYSGVEIEIKPGHPATRFKPIKYAVKGDGDIRDILPFEVETYSADRDCSFAIVLKEPGQPDKIFRRSMQISPPATDAATAPRPQVFQCYLSSRGAGSKAAIATKPTPDPARKR